MSTEEERLQAQAEREGLGATGQYPRGHIKEAGQGELKAAFSISNGLIILNLGKSVSWLSMTAAQARTLANILVYYAEKLGE